MPDISIILPDNSTRTFDHEPTGLELAQSIGSRLAKDTVGVMIDGSNEVQDFRLPLKSGTKVKIVTVKDPEALQVIRHSAAHVMAQAVQEIWPDVKVTIGPVIDTGFYYDFASPRPFTPEDLEKIEIRMRDIIKRDLPVTKTVLRSREAIEKFKAMGENFKVEIIQDLGSDEVSVYHQGEWSDLCRGPHVQKLGQIKAIKVLSLAGAYWRGDEKREQLQRVYATAFLSQEALDKHMHDLEEAKKRDHRRLGKDLGLFVFHQFAPGSPFFAPNGTIVYNELIKFLRELYFKYGYQEVITPQLFDLDLYKQSGHYDNYRENMYFSEVDERMFSMKPMNCPGHFLLYGSDKRSYRDLPWRVADFGRLHRHERSGVMHGLTRVRSFCQDDAHIFCTMDQIQGEIVGFMNLLKEIYSTLGMPEYRVYFSTRPAKRLGSDEIWDRAEGALKNAMEALRIPYTLNPGDGAFYGPKLDVMFVDSINRPWQLGTLQMDFNAPEAFKMGYIGDDNKEHRPVVLHRAILGSFERFIGVYLEHVAGHLPTWMAPLQVQIMNVTDSQIEYGRELEQMLIAQQVRVKFDARGEKLGFKIREAQMARVPFMLVIGENEKNTRTVSVRLRNGQTVNGLSINEFIEKLKMEITERKFRSVFENTNNNQNKEQDHKTV